MKNTPKFVYTAVVFTLLGGFSVGLILLAKGYTLSPKEGTVAVGKTGWILMKSSPDGAKTFLNEKPTAPTNNSLGGLEPGTYEAKIQKEGYHEWKKSLPVKEEFVTIVDALLIKRAAEIKPVTLTGVTAPSADDTHTQIAYYSEGDEQVGLWVYSLEGGIIGAGRTNPILVAEGTEFRNTTSIEWSPDSTQLITTVVNTEVGLERQILLNLNEDNIPPFPSLREETAENIREDWSEERRLNREKIVSTLDLPKNYADIVLDEATLISPDEKKFLYTVSSDQGKEYHVINTTEPLPIGYSEDMIVLRHNTGEDTEVLWHSTSEHLIVIEGSSISLMEIDGGNKTAILSTNLYDNLVIPTPNGRNIIINTTFTTDNLPNLHSIYFN